MPSDGRREPPDPAPAGSRRAACREFLSALAEPLTYNPRRNVYTLFGLLWGVPVPLFSIAIHLMASGRPLTWDGCCAAVAEFPLHWFFAAHPLLFGVVFGAMGAVRHRKDGQIARLIDDLASKVRALAEANDRLKDLDRMKSDFLANVSHELKTPLVCLSGYTEMLAQGRLGGISERQRDALEVMARNGERLLRMIEELLEFGKLESGHTRFTRVPFDLAETARAAAAPLVPIVRERGLRIELEGLDRVVSALGDREKILRVFVNLLSNACKFTPKGKRIGMRLRPAEEEVEAEVWDEGDGLTPEEQKHMFERFWQADASSTRPAGGSGLGLAIVKEILDLHGVRIQVRSSAGGGTSIRFRLPRAVSSAPRPGDRVADTLPMGAS